MVELSVTSAKLQVAHSAISNAIRGMEPMQQGLATCTQRHEHHRAMSARFARFFPSASKTQRRVHCNSVFALTCTMHAPGAAATALLLLVLFGIVAAAPNNTRSCYQADEDCVCHDSTHNTSFTALWLLSLPPSPAFELRVVQEDSKIRSMATAPGQIISFDPPLVGLHVSLKVREHAVLLANCSFRCSVLLLLHERSARRHRGGSGAISLDCAGQSRILPVSLQCGPHGIARVSPRAPESANEVVCVCACNGTVPVGARLPDGAARAAAALHTGTRDARLSDGQMGSSGERHISAAGQAHARRICHWRAFVPRVAVVVALYRAKVCNQL